MKNFKTLVLALVLALVVSFTEQKEAGAALINPNENSHVVFYIPHQDDEALTFGTAIMNHVRGGHNVHVVLLTDGAASGVRAELGMTEADFTAARNREFAYSLSLMGVKPQNIEYKNFKDGALTLAQAESIIKAYETKYPQAKHKAFSYTDENTDHNISGKALENLRQAGIVTEPRFYVRGTSDGAGKTLMKEYFSEDFRPFLLAVNAVYRIENSRLGYYGIGYKSVPKSFEAFAAQPVSRYHK